MGSQRNAVQVIEELTECLKNANEWQAGIVQTLGRTGEWQGTMTEKFQELRESHEDVTHRLHEAFKVAVESGMVVDQAMNAADQEVSGSSCYMDDSSERLQSCINFNRTQQGNIDILEVNCGSV